MNPLLDALSSVRNPNLADLEDIGRIPPKALIDALVTQGANLAGLPMDMAYLAQSGINKGMDLLGVPNPYPLGELKDTVMTSDWMADKAGVDTESIPYLVGSMLTPDPSTAVKFGPLMQAMTVFHGSPHKWDRVDLSKVGTGEGAQAYGHGFYAAENPGVAESYKKMSDAQDLVIHKNGKEVARGNEIGDEVLEAYKFLEMGRRDAGQFPHNTAYYAKKYADKAAEGLPGAKARNEKVKALIDQYADAEFAYEPNTGNLYELDLPDETIAKMLDWDKPLSEQPESVRKLIEADPRLKDAIARRKKYREEYLTPRLNDPYNPLAQDDFGRLSEPTGNDLYEMIQAFGADSMGFHHSDPQKFASEYLNSLGIPGIKYLDGTSRSAGDGTRNFVIFDEQYITPLKRNGEPIIKENP